MESTTHSLLVQYGPLVVISVAAISIGLLVVAGVAFGWTRLLVAGQPSGGKKRIRLRDG